MKKLFLLAGLAFLVFWMVTDPAGLAGTAQGSGSWAWDASGDLASALREFVRAL